MNLTRIFGLSAIGVLTIITLFCGGSILENVDADEIAVFQSPSGDMSVVTTPGWTYQGFAKVTVYKRRGTIHFAPSDGADGRLPVVFNDAGKGLIKGSISYELPLDTERMLEVHKRWPSQEGLESSLIKPALNKSIYMTGPLMSSYESYKERRPQLIQYVEDQVQNGVYQTRSYETEREDEFTPGLKKRVTVVEVLTKDGVKQRAEEGQLSKFGVQTFNFAIEELAYDERVNQQINDQQNITMAVQTSIASAKQAEQDALTAKAKGEANVAQTRAAQEVEKTKATVAAEQRRDVARLGAEEAEFYKKERLTRADADAEAARRMIVADGALDKKLAVYKEVALEVARNIPKMNVASTVIGSSGGTTAAGGAMAGQAFFDIFTAKMARDLALDVTPGKNPQ